MEDRDKILDYTKPVRLQDNCSKNRKNFTQGYYYREIGSYKNVIPSEFQWAAEDKLIDKHYEELKCQLPDSPRSTFLMVFSPDGKKVASTHGNHNIYVTDLTTGKNIQTLSGHPRTPWCIAFHPSSNQILASGCLGGQVRVWDLRGRSEVWTTESQTVIASLAFHPVDRMLVIATYNELHFWDWSQPEPFAKCSTKSGREKVRYVSFDRLGNKLITGIANPVNAPSQWDRINVVSSQTPLTSSTTTTTSTASTSFNSTPPTTTASQSGDQERSLTSWFRNSISRYNQLVGIARNTPTIDRGTDPMDLLDLRSNRSNNTEGSSSNPSPSTSNPQVNPSSPLRFKITRSACRSYRPLSCCERFRIYSSVYKRLRSRSSHSLNSTASNTTPSQSSVLTNPSTSSTPTPVSRDTYIPRLRRLNLRNLYPVRRVRDNDNSHEESSETSRRESNSVPQSLMHPRPVPRFQVRSRYFQDQQSQLHLLTNRETHGLNLQNNQNLRRQLSFRPGGQFVLSRHSNSPFQPRVPHQADGTAQTSTSTSVKNTDPRFEIPSQRTSCNTSTSNVTEVGTSSSSSTGCSVASNLSFTGENSHQLPDQINRRLFDRVKMMLRDRIRNSSENASTDSTVNYSRISDPLDCDCDCDGIASRGLGPRGADPMLSSVSENLDSTNELLHNSGSSSPTSTNVNGASSNNSSLNMSHSDLLDPWETEPDNSPFSISASLPLGDVLNEPSQETTSQNEAETAESSQVPSATSSAIDNSNPSSPEFSMRQGIHLLSLHIENMQRLCWARIEILELQKIRKMWEDLTNQIRQFHNIIQNRSLGESSTSLGLNDSSNSGGDIPSMRNLAISSSPIPDRNQECSSSSSATPNDTISGSRRTNYKETSTNELFSERKKSYSGCSFKKFQGSSEEKNSERNKTERGSSSDARRNETEEPQPGPSGLSTPSTSRGVRNSILQLEYRVYKLLRDIIQKTRRKREGRDSGISSSSGFQRHSQTSGVKNSSRAKFRSHRYSGRLDSSGSRSRALSRELEAIWQTWRNERSASQPRRGSGDCDPNEPSTSTPKTSSNACQSCGQKRKPAKELCRQKRSAESACGSASSGSASKILKNNAGERSEAPSNESQEREAPASTSSSQDNPTNDLLRQMLQTMEAMLHFQREAFQSTKDGKKNRPARANLSAGSSGEDSDSDENDSNEQVFSGSASRRGERESILNSMQDVARMRAKRLLGFMVKSLNQFFGKNFRNLNQVLDEQIFSLYMLLDLALELTDLLLEQLNARSSDLERNWETESPENSKRNWNLPKSAGTVERTRERNRRPYIPFYSANREDPRNRFSTNPFLRSRAGSISTRRNSSGTPNAVHDRFLSSLLKCNCRRKRATARMSTSGLQRWYYHRSRTPSQASSSNSNSVTPSRSIGGNLLGNRYRSFCCDRRLRGEVNFGMRASSYEINNNSNNNDTNNNFSPNDDRNNNRSNNNNSNNGGNGNDDSSNNTNTDNSNSLGATSSRDISSNNNSFLNYYFQNSSNSSSNSESGNNIILVTGLSSSSDNRSSLNNTSQNGSNVSFINQNTLPPLRSMELTLSRNESGDLSLRDERPIFWIRYGGNSESSGSLNSGDSQPRVSGFTVPIVQVNDVPVSDVSVLNQPRHRPQSPVPRVSEDIWRWRAWRPRFLHPRYGGPNAFEDQDSNDVPENIHYYRISSTSAGSHLGVYTLDPMIITDAPMSSLHRIQAWDFSKMNIPDISDREANGVVPECKIHNDASVDVSNDGHLLVTLLPSGRLSVTTMLGVYSLDWSSLGQLLYRTSFEQNAVSVSLSPTNRHLLVGLASRTVVLRDRTNMAQIFRLEGGRPSPHGGSWQSGRGRLVHIRDLEQTREMNIMSLNCIRWAPGAGQGLVYGTSNGLLKVLR